MQHNFIRFISKIDIKHPNITRLFCISNGAIRLVRMFPRPHAGTFFALDDFTIHFSRIYQCNISIIHLRLLIQKSKDPFRSCDSHNDRVDLMRNLIHITRKLLCHI